MGVSTKWVKYVVRHPDVCLPSRGDWIVVSDAHPEIAVVYRKHPDGGSTVLTVLYRTNEWYERPASA
jgi:hypothetical protein